MKKDSLFKGMVEHLYMDEGLVFDALPEVQAANAERDALVKELEKGTFDFKKRSIQDAIGDVAYSFAFAYFNEGFKLGVSFQQWVNK